MLQITRFMDALDDMELQLDRRVHRVHGELATARKLLRKHVMGTHCLKTGQTILEDVVPTTVWCSDSATIQSSAWVVRMAAGTETHAREHTDYYAYVPFRSSTGMNHCVLEIKQILLVQRASMG